jgi:hypothetical protein
VHNAAGISSRLYWSNGVLVGKNEVYPPPDQPSVIAFDTYRVTNTSLNSTLRSVVDKPVFGAVSLPPNALGAGESVVAGSVGPGDYGAGGVVDPQATPPANNVRREGTIECRTYTVNPACSGTAG